MEQHNHLFPAFHIRKWVDNGGQVYDKQLKKGKQVSSHQLQERLYKAVLLFTWES